jgi:hypothetical protein
MLPTIFDPPAVPECRSYTLRFFKRFELSEAVERLKRLERATAFQVERLERSTAVERLERL